MSTLKSISGVIGKGSIRHNNRDFYAANVDRSRTKDNIVLCNENLKYAYHQLFDEALTEYNAKQKRKDRRIASKQRPNSAINPLRECEIFSVKTIFL